MKPRTSCSLCHTLGKDDGTCAVCELQKDVGRMFRTIVLVVLVAWAVGFLVAAVTP